MNPITRLKTLLHPGKFLFSRIHVKARCENGTSAVGVRRHGLIGEEVKHESANGTCLPSLPIYRLPGRPCVPVITATGRLNITLKRTEEVEAGCCNPTTSGSAFSDRLRQTVEFHRGGQA